MTLLNLKNNKGFTLVEIVVVLVILAILAAISVPSLAGYISDSKDRSRVTETESVAVAAETAALRAYKVGTKISDINGSDNIGKNVRKKALTITGASGKIVGYRISDGSNEGTTPSTPAPNSKNFTKAGTLEFLQYEGSNGEWYGVYRILADGKVEVKVDKNRMQSQGADIND